MECIYLENFMGYEQEIWELLKECNRDFIPPLSARNSSTQKELNLDTSVSNAEEEPTAYFEELKKQYFIVAKREGEVVGFLTCIPNKYIGIDEFEYADYLTTIIVRPSARRLHVAQTLYQALLEHCQGKKIVTRTWSLNEAHIHLLGRLGFQLIKRIENDRGQGIDTVYFGKDLSV